MSSSQSRSGLCLQRPAPGRPRSPMLLGLTLFWTTGIWFEIVHEKKIYKCTKLKRWEQRDEGCKNLRISWSLHHPQAAEGLAPGAGSPPWGAAAGAGETPGEGWVSSLGGAGGTYDSAEQAPVIQEPSGQRFSTAVTGTTRAMPRGAQKDFPQTLSGTLSHCQDVWAPSGHRLCRRD